MQPQFPPIVYLICPVVSRYCDHYASIEFNLLISRVVAFAWWPIISPHGRMEGARSDGEGGTGRAPKIEYFGEKAWWKSSVEMERYASFRRNCFWPALSKRNRLSPSPSLRLTRFHGTRFVFSSRVSFLRALMHVFDANGWSRELNRISY